MEFSADETPEESINDFFDSFLKNSVEKSDYKQEDDNQQK